ncbi:hypothetical protein TNCV_2449701 [Trichonephila clavipes]|uniref:Uncharacterized protein n=1 Tax=Trichonephila clavipes TaxID=2585209 RepID=A0A8X6RGU0_TRICX|nr:hypothetical protein TNCV_2449701 [Trichonephila clavipes]
MTTIQTLDDNIATHQNIIDNNKKNGRNRDNSAIQKNIEKIMEIKKNLKAKKRENKKQDSEGFAFPKKSARPTTPTQVLEPIPTQNNFENLIQDPKPMNESSQEKEPPTPGPHFR